jgi:excisionase family DNA binding protein
LWADELWSPPNNGHHHERKELMDKLLLTHEETAEVLGICRSKVYELLRAGAIESVRIGASRRIPVAAVTEYVERLRREAAA